MGRATKAEEKAKQAGKNKAKEAAEVAARETLLTLSSDDDGETHDFLASDRDVAADINEYSTDDEANKDIFSDIGEERVKKGDIIKYTIFKYGSQLASVYHPCSWEQIHKKYGDGQYKVLARSQSLNRIVKTQSRMLGQPASEFTMAGFQGSQQDEERQVEAPTQPQQPGFMEIFSLIMNQQNQVKAEARENNNSSQQSNNQMMMMFMEMMKSNQTQSMQSQLQMMEMVTKVTEKMGESQTRMFEKINERFERLAAEKTKAPDIETIVERMQLAQDKGFALYQKFDELATKKAEIQLEMMGNNDDDDDDDDKPEKESLTDTLIKTIIPMMAAGQRQMPQQFAPRSPRGQLTRRPAPQGNARPNAQGIGRQRVATPPGHASRPQNAEQNPGSNAINLSADGKMDSENVVDVSAQEVVTKMRGALPEVDVTTVTNDPFDFSDDSDEGLVELPRSSNDSDAVQAKCKEILPTILGELMLEGIAADEGADKVVETLLAHEITKEEFLAHVSAQDFGEFAKQYSLPPEAYLWLNELYANLQNTARIDVGSELTSSDEHEIAAGSPG